jgi:hypothetical protein
MSSFPILDLVAGIIFVYFMLSIITSSLVETVLTLFRIRAKLLEQWITELFNKPVAVPKGHAPESLGQSILDHCSITALSGKGKSNAFMHARDFTSALLEKITYDPSNPKSIATDINTVIELIGLAESVPESMKRVLLQYANEAKQTYAALSIKTVSEIDLFRSKVENWFDTNMEQVGDTLKTRYARPMTFFATLLVVVLLNADTISISKYLYSNPEARAAVAARAYATVDNDSLQNTYNTLGSDTTRSKADSLTLAQFTDMLNDRVLKLKEAEASLQSDLPLGWNNDVFIGAKGKLSGWLILSKLVGLAMTLFAVMMGAPFWFDVLNKVANVRGSGKKTVTEKKKK